MKICWIYIVYVTLCQHVKYSIQQYGLPSSPCPSLFQYQHDGNEWYGSVLITNLRLGQPANLSVMLSLRGVLSQRQQYKSTVERFGSQETAVQEIRSNRPVRYRVRFPLQSRLPKLTQLQVNGQILCTGQPETGLFVTQITLHHSLFTEKAAAYFRVSNFGNFHSLDPFVIYNNNADQDSKNYYPKQQVQPPRAPSLPYYAPTNSQAHVQSPQRPTQSTIRPSYGSQSESDICGGSHERFQIAPLVVGGEIVSRGAWPWLVAVYLKKLTGLTYNCGGTLVSRTVVVTAAHCFHTAGQTYSAKDVLLILGKYNIRNWTEIGSRMIEVEQLIIHNDYMSRDASYDADIAIAIMRDRVEYNEYIRPICLWDGSDDLNEIVGSMGTVVGWGRDGSGNIVSSEPKMVKIPVVSEAVCLRSSDAYRYITSNRTFCAGGQNGKGPCNGDSGSGMIMVRNKRWHLRGIVSAALADPIMNLCNLEDYVMCTDAAKFGDWIRSHMR